MTDLPVVLGPGETLQTYYGSWTTANGYYQPFLDEEAWWCVQSNQPTAAGATFDYYGEDMPSTLTYYEGTSTDEDSDGIEDHVDWAGSYGVQAQYNVWAWQAAHDVLTVGKTAEEDAGDVVVTLTVRNIGDTAGTGTVTDTIPDGWTLVSTDTAPDSTTVNGDGSTTLVWSVSVDGMNGTTTIDMVVITYVIERDVVADVPYLELDEASVDYHDGSAAATSYSFPAAVFNVDVDQDGEEECTEDEVCDGVDNDLDGEVDEGFDVDADGVADCFDTEECDGYDNDGDGEVDEGFDVDMDGIADCFDTEECDGYDNDGDGEVDEGFDADGDGTADCFDTEECDGLDNDGDGDVDEDMPDSDGDGVCDDIDPVDGCHTTEPGTQPYCSEACPCDEGEGDCDSDLECADGLFCVDDQGLDHGFAWYIDVCLADCHLSDLGTSTYCTEDCPCLEGEGGCSDDIECDDGLTCKADAGSDYGLPWYVDVCVSNCHDGTPGTAAYCTEDCPCDEGEGSCSGDAECADGLTCVPNVGASYGYSWWIDVCMADCHTTAPGSQPYCSEDCPCEAGQGDCDSDEECGAGLTCVADVGADYGWAWYIDVCE